MQRSRERVRRRRELARERDREVSAAVRRYLADWQAISACEAKRDSEIAELRRRISAVEDEAAAQISGLRADQGQAAAIIRDQPGHTDDDVADLLEITPKQVRQLITLARTQPNDPADSAADDVEQTEITHDQAVQTEEAQTDTDGARALTTTGDSVPTDPSK
ncbi:hypothetical protein [Nocardia noduli]|uniref:hypothetical protein n=1 Tax=Nocardia noduli TaxID=2815722 RepID=UPI001C22F524|nr:hypothetical protein [Nocardia noduli]